MNAYITQPMTMPELQAILERFRKGLKSYKKKGPVSRDESTEEIMFLAGLKTGRQINNDTKASIEALARIYENNYTSSERLDTILRLLNGPPSVKGPKQQKVANNQPLVKSQWNIGSSNGLIEELPDPQPGAFVQ